MDSALIKAIGLKALLVGVGALLLFWTFNAIKLVISARGINPLVKKFFDQIAVNRQDFIKFLGSLQLNRYRNLKSGRPRIEDNQIMLTLNLKSEDKKNEMPLDFTFIKIEENWQIDRIAKSNR